MTAGRFKRERDHERDLERGRERLGGDVPDISLFYLWQSNAGQ